MSGWSAFSVAQEKNLGKDWRAHTGTNTGRILNTGKQGWEEDRVPTLLLAEQASRVLGGCHLGCGGTQRDTERGWAGSPTQDHPHRTVGEKMSWKDDGQPDVNFLGTKILWRP